MACGRVEGGGRIQGGVQFHWQAGHSPVLGGVGCASVTGACWGWGQGPSSTGPGMRWGSIGPGKGHQDRIQGRVPLPCGSLTRSGLCVLGLLGSRLLGVWGGLSRETRGWGGDSVGLGEGCWGRIQN